jgi:glycosyltransferase involved in cell wall biosynthesis
MKISVIIPALNEAKHILGSLDSIERQQGEFEIIIVDGRIKYRVLVLKIHTLSYLSQDRFH